MLGKLLKLLRKIDRSFLIKASFLLFSFSLFFFNTLHEKYPDEFDNILGGQYLLSGKTIYSDFFTHHGPVAYLFSAIIEIFAGGSFVNFRIIYSLVIFLFLIFTYRYLKNRFNFENTKFYLFFILLIGFSSTYFWGHMLLADNLSALLLAPVFALLVLLTVQKEKIKNKDIIFISVLTSLSTLASLTFSYLAVVIYLYVLYLYKMATTGRIFSKDLAKRVLILALPYIVFLIYLILTQTLFEFIKQAVIFNGRYYVYNYPGIDKVQFINPLRHIIIIAHDFIKNFYIVLRGVKGFNFDFPVNVTLAVANTSFLIYLIVRKKYLLAFVSFLILIFANTRSNPLTSGETDYQSSVYIMLSLFNLSFVIPRFYELLKENMNYGKKILLGIVFLLLSIYATFFVAFIVHKFNDRVFLKYMGLEPLIYNRPKIAPIINTVAGKNDYAWIGPFHFEELFYLNAKVPSKYHILIPEFERIPDIQAKMLNDFTVNKPKIIYFDKYMGLRNYLPENYARFFLDFLDKNYITFINYEEEKVKYSSTIPPTEKVDIEVKLFILKESKDEIIKKLLDANIIKKSQP